MTAKFKRASDNLKRYKEMLRRVRNGYVRDENRTSKTLVAILEKNIRNERAALDALIPQL